MKVLLVPICDCRFAIADLRLPIADLRLPIADSFQSVSAQ